MATAKDKGDIVPAGQSSYAIARVGEASDMVLADAVQDNLGAGGITAFDLDRVRIPAGGGKAWELPTLDGEPEVARTFDGIIVHWREPRAYWPESLDVTGGGTPPACSSIDGVRGDGDPGGDCGTCPLSQYGSGRDGRGQACKQTRALFIVREESLLPVVLFCPPTSIAPMRKYFLRLASQNRRFSDVVTRFSLGTATSQAGISYSVVEPSVVRVLDPAEIGAVREYSHGIAKALDAVRMTAADATISA